MACKESRRTTSPSDTGPPLSQSFIGIEGEHQQEAQERRSHLDLQDRAEQGSAAQAHIPMARIENVFVVGSDLGHAIIIAARPQRDQGEFRLGPGGDKGCGFENGKVDSVDRHPGDVPPSSPARNDPPS